MGIFYRSILNSRNSIFATNSLEKDFFQISEYLTHKHVEDIFYLKTESKPLDKTNMHGIKVITNKDAIIRCFRNYSLDKSKAYLYKINDLDLNELYRFLATSYWFIYCVPLIQIEPLFREGFIYRNTVDVSYFELYKEKY